MSFRTVFRTPSAYADPLLIKNLLATPLIYSPNQEIVYRDRLRHDYRTFAERVSRLASMLRAMGVRPGDVVAMLDWDSHRYLEAFFAVPMMGAVLHTVNVRLSPDQLLYTINHAKDDVLLVNTEFLPLIEPLRDRLETVRAIVALSDDGSVPETALSIDGDYESLLTGADPDFAFPDFDENTMATLFYTTGTTGLPKGVCFSHRQLVLHTLGLTGGLCAFDSQARVGSADVYMPITPMFHVHAWGMPYLMTLLGAKQVYPGRYEPEMLIRLVLGEKVTFSHCVPTILHMLVNSPKVRGMDFKGWKVIIGGSALSRGLCKAALDLNINVYTGYGMSETCPVLTLANLKPHMLESPEEEQVKMRCRTGLPIPLVRLDAIAPDGRSVPRDGKTPGEVVVRAPWLTQGYLEDPERSEELWQGGWLRTQDVGFIDEEGYLQITDRTKDVIKTGGEWISSLMLEDVASRLEGVSETAVIGIPDEKWGERPMVLVKPKPGSRGAVDEAAVCEHFRKCAETGEIPKFAVPERVLFVEDIAKTSVGKIDKKTLRKQYS